MKKLFLLHSILVFISAFLGCQGTEIQLANVGEMHKEATILIHLSEDYLSYIAPTKDIYLIVKPEQLSYSKRYLAAAQGQGLQHHICIVDESDGLSIFEKSASCIEGFKAHFSGIRAIVTEPSDESLLAGDRLRAKYQVHNAQSTKMLNSHDLRNSLRQNSPLLRIAGINQKEFVDGELVQFEGLVKENLRLADYAMDCQVFPLDLYQSPSFRRCSLVAAESQPDHYKKFLDTVLGALGYHNGPFSIKAAKSLDGQLAFIDFQMKPNESLKGVLKELGFDARKAYISHQLNNHYKPDSQYVPFSTIDLKAPDLDTELWDCSELKHMPLESFQSLSLKLCEVAEANQLNKLQAMASFAFLNQDSDLVVRETQDMLDSLQAVLKPVYGNLSQYQVEFLNGAWVYSGELHNFYNERNERLIAQFKNKIKQHQFEVIPYNYEPLQKNRVFIRKKEDILSKGTTSPALAVNSRLIFADYQAIRKDYPSFADLSDHEIEKWLINNLSYMASTQLFPLDFSDLINRYPEEHIDIHLLSQLLNDGKDLSGRRHDFLCEHSFKLKQEERGDALSRFIYDIEDSKSILRPYRYGRAAYIDAGYEGASQVFDVKGLGAIEPSMKDHRSGLARIDDIIYEILFQKYLQRIFQLEASEFTTIEMYAVLALDNKIDGKTAGLLVRRPSNRYLKEMSQLRSAIEVEGLLRHWGITSIHPNEIRKFGEKVYSATNVQGAIDHKSLIDFSHYRLNQLGLYRDCLVPHLDFINCLSEQDVECCLQRKMVLCPDDKGYTKQAVKVLDIDIKRYHIDILKAFRSGNIIKAKKLFETYLSEVHNSFGKSIN